MRIIQKLINDRKQSKAKSLMKKIQKKKKQIDNLKEDIFKMAERLKLVNGKLVKVDDEAQTEVPKVEQPKAEKVEMEPLPVQKVPQGEIVRESEDITIEEDEDDFPEDVMSEPEEYEDIDYEEEQPVQRQVPREPSQPEVEKGIIIMNIQDSEPLQLMIPLESLDVTIENIRAAIANQDTIVVENVIVNAKYIISFTALVQ